MIERILLVEDEESLVDAIKMNLEMENYEVVVAPTGANAVKKFGEERFNLIILDIMLPEMNGYEVCQAIRARDFETPILFLTAKDSNEDKVRGLKMGADDYLTKPFNLEELLLRSKILVKRSIHGTAKEKRNHVFTFGKNQINFNTYEIIGAKGKKWKLHEREIALLKLLIDKKEEVVSRKTILQTVWGYDVLRSTRTIDNHILAFRKYFETDSRNPKHFFSIRGVGYKFME